MAVFKRIDSKLTWNPASSDPLKNPSVDVPCNTWSICSIAIAYAAQDISYTATTAYYSVAKTTS